MGVHYLRIRSGGATVMEHTAHVGVKCNTNGEGPLDNQIKYTFLLEVRQRLEERHRSAEEKTPKS